MQKGEWLPFSRLFSFCIPWPVKSALHFTGLHSAFCISTHGARHPLLWGRVRGNGAHVVPAGSGSLSLLTRVVAATIG